MTYKDFGLTEFNEEKRLMEEFSNSCFGESMRTLWQSLKESYFPKKTALDIFAKFTFDAAGNATPDRLFARSTDDDQVFDFKEPIVAVKVHTALSILTGQMPDVRWDSPTSYYEKKTPVINALRKNDWMDDLTRQQYVMLWYYFILFGTTFWRRFYKKDEREVFLPSKINLATDEIEYEPRTMVDYDQVTAEALSPLQVWIDPATKPFNPNSMKKVKYDKVFDYQDFLREFEGKVSKAVLDTILPTSLVDKGGPVGDNSVLCEYYENENLDLYYVVAQDKELLKGHLPYNHKQLSVLMSVWMPRGDQNPFGLGPIEMLMEDKEALDEFKSMTFTQVKFSIYKAVFHSGSLTGSGGESGDIRIRPDQTYKTTDPKGINFYDMPGPGRDSWDAMALLRERIDDASGINRPLGGEIVKTTAFQTDLAKDAALARLNVPINSMVSLLRRDAELMLELQKQYYSLPEVRELVDDKEITDAYEELAQIQLSGARPTFSLFVDETEKGTQVFRGDFRSIQLNFEELPGGQSVPALGNQEITLTPEVFDWKGKIHVISDSLLTLTPTIDRQRKLELFNLLLPLFAQPPQLMAKSARELVKIYGQNIEDFFPEDWLLYLKQLATGEMPAPTAPGPEVPLQPPTNDEKGNLTFEQERQPTAITSMGGQKDLISAQSEQISP